MPRHSLTKRTTVCCAAVAFLLISAFGLTCIAADGNASTAATHRMDLLRGAERVVFLGDSITYGGHYVAYFDAWLLTQEMAKRPTVINVGLPSETVSGLSEDGHAGGKFPRPDLGERLKRVLAATKPDLVIACYGMNCGIYLPLDEQRFGRYRQGIEDLKRHVEAAGATLVLVTPPCYDDQRRPKEGFRYDDVLEQYGRWLLSRREQGWLVVDLHDAMAGTLRQRRTSEPEFTFQGDAVHPNEQGHWVMAQALIRWFGNGQAADAASPEQMLADAGVPQDVLPLVRQRMSVLRDAYLSAAGHQRPGIRAGLPVQQAQQEAAQLTEQIRGLNENEP
jgi:lysophospholipase L1-like esterase